MCGVCLSTAVDMTPQLTAAAGAAGATALSGVLRRFRGARHPVDQDVVPTDVAPRVVDVGSGVDELPSPTVPARRRRHRDRVLTTA